MTRSFRRALWALACSALLLTAALLALMTSSATAARAHATPGSDGLEKTCVKAIFGGSDATKATADSGPVPAALVKDFSVFSRPAGAADAFTATESVARAVAEFGATSYDADGVRQLTSDANGDAVYLVPVTLRTISVPADCASVKALKGYSAVIAEDRTTTGSGPGVCAISTFQQAEGNNGQSVAEVDDTSCESLTVFDSYYGAVSLTALLTDPFTGGDKTIQLSDVVPDAVHIVNDTFTTTRSTAVASSNLVTIDGPGVSAGTTTGTPTAATLTKAVTRALPITIDELGANSQSVASYVRPADAVSINVKAALFEIQLDKLATQSTGVEVTATGSGTSPSINANCSNSGACSASFTTKKCGAKTCQVTVTTVHCNTKHVCTSSSKTRRESKSKADKGSNGSTSVGGGATGSFFVRSATP